MQWFCRNIPQNQIKVNIFHLTVAMAQKSQIAYQLQAKIEFYKLRMRNQKTAVIDTGALQKRWKMLTNGTWLLH